jgi:hypothetical protein
MSSVRDACFMKLGRSWVWGLTSMVIGLEIWC